MQTKLSEQEGIVNQARTSATMQARDRANREQRSMCVYVAPPDARGTFKENKSNIWYVRPLGDPAPERSELVYTVTPEPSGNVEWHKAQKPFRDMGNCYYDALNRCIYWGSERAVEAQLYIKQNLK